MKAQHRHELKTNELADWLTHLPRWAADNRNGIIAVVAVVVIAVAVYVWKVHFYDTGRLERRIALTTAVAEVTQRKAQVAAGQSQGADLSYLLIQPADTLQTLAAGEANPNMAAFAHIKRGEALRAEVHFRMTGLTSNVLQTQIGLARDAYTAALESKPALASIRGAAKLGLGLCAEELGDFTQARQVYQEIDGDPAFKGTVALASARTRLATLDEFTQPIAFHPAPAPLVQIQPFDPNKAPDLPDLGALIPDANRASAPIITIKPADANLAAPVVEINTPAPEPAPAGVPVAEPNQPAVQPADANSAAPPADADGAAPPAAAIEANQPAR